HRRHDAASTRGARGRDLGGFHREPPLQSFSLNQRLRVLARHQAGALTDPPEGSWAPRGGASSGRASGEGPGARNPPIRTVATAGERKPSIFGVSSPFGGESGSFLDCCPGGCPDAVDLSSAGGCAGQAPPNALRSGGFLWRPAASPGRRLTRRGR